MEPATLSRCQLPPPFSTNQLFLNSMRKLGERFEGDSREIELVAGYLHLNFFHLFLAGIQTDHMKCLNFLVPQETNLMESNNGTATKWNLKSTSR